MKPTTQACTRPTRKALAHRHSSFIEPPPSQQIFKPTPSFNPPQAPQQVTATTTMSIPDPTITPADVEKFNGRVKEFEEWVLSSAGTSGPSVGRKTLLSIGKGLSYLLTITKDGAAGGSITPKTNDEIGRNFRKMQIQKHEGADPYADFVTNFPLSVSSIDASFKSRADTLTQWDGMTKDEKGVVAVRQMMRNWLVGGRELVSWL